MEHELTRCTMRMGHVQEGKMLKAKCTTQAAHIERGIMVQPSGRCVHMWSKTGDVKRRT